MSGDTTTNAMLGYLSGLSGVLGGVGQVVGLVITVYLAAFNATDILVNQDGTLTEKGKRIGVYLTIQVTQFFAGLISSNNAAAFVSTLITNVIYLNFFGMYIDKYIKGDVK